MSTTVSMLCALTEGMTSSDSILEGYLRTLDCDQPIYKKGTLLLFDATTMEMIPCLIDRFCPQINEKGVEIKEWNYIYDEKNGYRYLEFSLVNVFTQRAELSALHSGIIEDLAVVNSAIESGTLFYTPSLSRKHVSQSSVNAAGVVVAISPLYTPLHSEARFFVEIADSDEKSAITLSFCGDKDIHYQLCFRIGQYYTFTDLSPVTISYGRYTRNVLQYQQSSTFQIITASLYQQLEFIEDSPADQHTLTVSKISDEKTTYTGYITRIIDSVLGIYELDDAIILSVFHHFVSAQPFRVNTQIRITHYHKTYIYAENYRSFLLNDLWKMKEGLQGALVACNRTRIEIISFPRSCYIELNDLPALNDTREALAMYMITHRHTFAQCMRFLEIYATLVKRFKLVSLTADQFKSVVEKISRYIFKATNTPVTREHGDLGNDFFEHDKVCSAIGSKCTVDDKGFLSVYLDLYPVLGQCMDSLENKKEDYQVNMAGANFAFDASAIQIHSTNYTTSMGFYILGVINSNMDGRLILKDGNSSVLLSVRSGKNIQIGDMYLIRRAQYFYENLSYRKDSSTCELISAYLICDYDDLLKVFTKEDSSLIFQGRVPFDYDRLGFFGIGSNEKLSEDRQYVVGHVLKKFPITTSINKLGKYMMECRMVVRLYNLGTTMNDDFVKLDPTKFYDLILTSKNRSLHFYYQLNVDDWCVIYGLDQTETKLRTEPLDHFFMDSSHKIYPIIFSKNHINDAIVLSPLQGSRSATTVLPRPIIKISDIKNPERHCLMGNNTEYISVRGVVILKKFKQRSGCGVYDGSALALYDNYGLGTGVPNRKIELQLREPDSLKMITIDMDLTTVHYPLGLVHGATVLFRNLMRKIWNATTEYYNVGSETVIEVESSIATEQEHRIQNNPTEATSIDWIFKTNRKGEDISEKLLQVYCNVSTVMALHLKWKCSSCGFTIRIPNVMQCAKMQIVCLVPPCLLKSDGTASAEANLYGERLVFRMLRLSNAQITSLKTFCSLKK
ncbi:unnamed protein product [Mucor hiemalis]